MATTKSSFYKRFNGTDWDTIYFATSAAQVGESSTRFFIKPDSNTVNGQKFTQNGGITLYAGNIAMSSSDATTIKAAIEAAAAAIPTGVLTSSNYSTTLGSVYQAKDDDLTAIAGLTGTSGLLKKTAANTWTLDTTSYASSSSVVTAVSWDSTNKKITYTKNGSATDVVSASTLKTAMSLNNVANTGDSATPVSGGTTKFTTGGAYTELAKKVDKTTTVNGYALSSNVILGAGDIDFIDANSNKVTVQNALTSAITTAEGKTSSFAIVSESGSASTLDNEFHVVKGTSTNQDATIKQIQVASVSNGVATLPVTIVTNGNGNAFTGEIENIKVKQGDIIYTAEPGILDWWVVAVTSNSIIVASHDSDNPDLSGYQTKITSSAKLDWSLLKSVPTTLSGYGITDAKIASGTITLGGNSITPLTSSSTLDATKLSGTIPSSCYTNTTYESKAAASGGTAVSLVTTGEKATWNGKSVVSFTRNLTSGTKVGTITIDGTATDIYCQTNTDNDKKTSSTASTGAKLFLLGAAAQAATGSESKSNVNCYIGTDNSLYSNGNRVPTIFYADTVPTTGMVVGDICIEY